MAIKHGKTGTRNHNRWLNMKNRCTNVKHRDYHRYGGRGIKICERWINSFIDYENDIMMLDNAGVRGMSIDRIDNDGDYEPSNIRWADMHTQSVNQRILTKYKGVTKRGKRFLSRILVRGKQIYLGTYDTEIECAKAYDKYVIDNNLEHTINNI